MSDDRIIRTEARDVNGQPLVYECRLIATTCWICGAHITSARIMLSGQRTLETEGTITRFACGPAKVQAMPCQDELRIGIDFEPIRPAAGGNSTVAGRKPADGTQS